MEYRTLGNSDLRVSSIGLGCVTFGREIDAAASFAVLDRALEAGITLFDTAEAYGAGASEEILGRWLAERKARDKIVLTTKVRPPLDKARVLASAEASLRRLRTDCLDLFLLHSWDAAAPLDEILESLDSLVDQGKARAVGCSNFDAGQLRGALSLQQARGWARMEAVQPNYNLVVRDIESELLPLCAGEQVGVMTYSPLGGGFLTGKYSRRGEMPAGARFEVVPGMQPIYLTDAGFRVLTGLEAAAARLGESPAGLALAWAITSPGVTSVLIGARTPAHVDQALAAVAMEMPEELRAELSAL
jgi:aryl-alcohol dehydrogenase-like predicted oxidoreductase